MGQNDHRDPQDRGQVRGPARERDGAPVFFADLDFRSLWETHALPVVRGSKLPIFPHPAIGPRYPVFTMVGSRHVLPRFPGRR